MTFFNGETGGMKLEVYNAVPFTTRTLDIKPGQKPAVATYPPIVNADDASLNVCVTDVPVPCIFPSIKMYIVFELLTAAI